MMLSIVLGVALLAGTPSPAAAQSVFDEWVFQVFTYGPWTPFAQVGGGVSAAVPGGEISLHPTSGAVALAIGGVLNDSDRQVTVHEVGFAHINRPYGGGEAQAHSSWSIQGYPTWNNGSQQTPYPDRGFTRHWIILYGAAAFAERNYDLLFGLTESYSEAFQWPGTPKYIADVNGPIFGEAGTYPLDPILFNEDGYHYSEVGGEARGRGRFQGIDETERTAFDGGVYTFVVEESAPIAYIQRYPQIPTVPMGNTSSRLWVYTNGSDQGMALVSYQELIRIITHEQGL
jgi:hypothetical protein